jgi:HEAT repeat protein
MARPAQQDFQQTAEAESTRRTGASTQALRYSAVLAVLGAASLLAGFETARRTVPEPERESAAESLNTISLAASAHMPASENASAELERLPVQQRAERLLQRAMHGDRQSLEVLQENADQWQGQLKSTDELFDLVLAALNSADLRVRTAAIDVDLASNNLRKTPESITRLLRAIQSDSASEGMDLWRLGELGNRGVETKKVLSSLVAFTRSRSEHTRYWAVEGLSMLGNDATIDPLLERMAHDPSPRVRRLAASSLGQAGMLTREERLAAVPHLLNFADDDSLSASTRELVYGTLRVITGAELANDAGAWRAWWAKHDPAKERPRERAGVVTT